MPLAANSALNPGRLHTVTIAVRMPNGAQARTAPVLDPRVVIVDIDEKSLAEVGRFPWSRNVMARLVEQLTVKYEVAAVGFDVSFPEPDTSSGYDVLKQLAQGELQQVAGLQGQLARLQPQLDYDGLLAQAIQGQPVVLGYSLSGSQARGMLPKPAFTEDAAVSAGIFTAMPDRDGVVRSTALLRCCSVPWRCPAPQSRLPKAPPSVHHVACCSFLNVPGIIGIKEAT
eukprot:gene29083-36070_t